MSAYPDGQDSAVDERKVGGLKFQAQRYWYHANENGKVSWKQCESSETFGEIIDFVSGVSNTVPQLLARKGRPRLGNYLSNNRTCKDV